MAWDPSHVDLLSTGGRDGTISIWDLRTEGKKDEDGVTTLSPVIQLLGAHGEAKGKGRPKKGKGTPAPRSVTHLLYPEIGPYGLITSGSFDGYVLLTSPFTSSLIRQQDC